MKKSYVYIAAACMAYVAVPAHAASTCASYDGDIISLASWSGFCPNGNGGRMYVLPSPDPWSNCKTKGYWCYYNTSGQVVTVATCIECATGYTTSVTSLASAQTNNVCSNNISYNKCVVQSSGGTVTCNQTECGANNNKYYKYNDEYEISYKYNCSNNQCVKGAIVSYRCAMGYYGNGGSTSMTGCTRCPPVKNNKGDYVYGQTMGGGKVSKTDCFVAPGTVMSDPNGSGDYVFTNMCNYTE